MTVPRAGRWMLLALLGVYAAFAVGNGLDRLSLYQEVGGRAVPEFLRAHLYRQDARIALREGKLEQARLAAARAVRAAPIEPGSTSVLGSALFASGQPAPAHDAFRVAGRFGWRDIPAQVYLMLAALAFDDRKSAAERLDAIMRSAPDLEASQAAVTALEADERGRAALLARLAEGPGWLPVYARAAETLTGPAFANRIAMLERTAAAGHRPACGTLTDGVNRMAYEASRFDDAYRLWLLGCGGNAMAGAVTDPGFDRPLAGSPSPFDWTLPGAGGVSSAIDQGRLVARNDNAVREEVARQHLLLPPGPVELVWQASADGTVTGLADAVQLRCPDGSAAKVESRQPAGVGGQEYRLRVNVPPSCRPQLLSIRIDRSVGEARFGSVVARPAEPGAR